MFVLFERKIDQLIDGICIVFDLDGTLIHTAPALAKAGNDLLYELNLQPVSVETYSTFIGGGIPKQVQKLLEFSNYSFSVSLEKCIKKFKEFYYQDPLHGTSIFPDVEETLRILNNEYQNLAICTQKNERPARFILKEFCLLEYFSGFAFGDSLDVLKPDPMMVQLATKNFFSDRLIYVGDSLTDSKTARKSNSTFVLFTEGYRKNSVRELNPDYYFSEFSKLPDIIRHIQEN